MSPWKNYGEKNSMPGWSQIRLLLATDTSLTELYPKNNPKQHVAFPDTSKMTVDTECVGLGYVEGEKGEERNTQLRSMV